MSGGNDITEAVLWRRWRDGKGAAGRAVDEPDASVLAAYAERRLGRRDSDPETDPAIAAVEDWLAGHPEALDDIVAARAAVTGNADATLVARAQALIAAPHGNIVPLRRTAGWRGAVAWSGIAASLVAASLVGFSLGTNDWLNSDSGQDRIFEQVVIGPSASIIATDDEDGGI
ncbi:MAG TPA: hypothetical protein VH020_07600 [Stellaceae bacterium]|jgi:hypothetical protein|nr:hypothetical protein [Stellaceae bacterium]